MTTNNTVETKPPDLVRDTDLLSETGGDISGRTTPSSFRESPIGWGMSLVCGGIRSGSIDSREALVNYYNEATFLHQQEILSILASNNKEQRFNLLAESMFHACARNFLNDNSMRVRSQSTLLVYDSIEKFNSSNTYKPQVKKFKLSSIQKQLAQINSQLIADNILNVCGALGMPYEAMQVFLNRPDVVYRAFKSTFGSDVPNINGTTRGYALWVAYAAARQSYVNASSYVVDDLFFVDVHQVSPHDEDIDKVFKDIGIVLEPVTEILGYKLVETHGYYTLVPQSSFIQSKFTDIVNKARDNYWADHPEELSANLLQLAYVLNPYQEEFSAVLGILQQMSEFVPNINCITGPTPSGLPELIASHDSIQSLYTNATDLDGLTSIKYNVQVLTTALRRTLRHYARHYKEKDWHVEGKLLSVDQKAQMKKRLYDLVLSVDYDGWEQPIDNGWG